MRDYESVDLGSLCNAGPADLGEGPPIQPGMQAIHGIPFLVGAGERHVVLLGGGVLDTLEVPVGRVARSLVFAHRLLESGIDEGDLTGRLCATYVVRYDDGETIEQPVRERFEIGVVPSRWGQQALLAWTDSGNRLMSRYEGRWGLTGRRQAEVGLGGPYPDALYLWPWSNPRPEVAVEAVVVRPAGPRMVLAALTLGHLEESVFIRAGRRPVRLVLPQPEDAAASFAVEVEVDRGAATYPYPLPVEPASVFLADPFKGWGERSNTLASPAYVEVAATPSATVTVRNDGDLLGTFRWGERESSRPHRVSA
jgi:hypothetical protein